MKRGFFLMLLAILFCIYCGCSSENIDTNQNESENAYERGYEEGYSDGYNDAYEKSLDMPNYEDEVRSFYQAIVNLMYDHEYDTVQKLLDFNREGVENALVCEFGVSDIAVISDYLEKLSQTIVGYCEICGEPVYADNFYIQPDGVEFAHSTCMSGNSSGESRITKEQ